MRAAVGNPEREADAALDKALADLGRARSLRGNDKPSQAIHLATRANEYAKAAYVHARYARRGDIKKKATKAGSDARTVIRMALQQLRGERKSGQRREGQHQRHAHSILQGALSRDA